MLRTLCKSKIHAATVTEANLNYTGSVTIDSTLLEAADILVGEKVQIVNLNNGTRIETYAIEGKKGSGTICMNGAAARLAQPGDKVIIISYALLDTAEGRNFTPRTIFVDGKNKIKEKSE